MIKRLKNLWELSQYKVEHPPTPVGTTTDELRIVKDDAKDVQAEFFTEGSLEDYERQEEQDKGFINRVFGL